MQIELREVGFSYRRSSPVFVGMTATMLAGEVTAIVGPSGSGKSTLLEMIGGIRRATTGLILVDGDERLNRRSYAWISQTNPMLTGRSVVDNAAMGMIAEGALISDARRAAVRTLDEFGLGAKVESKVVSLSGGELQRVAIVRCVLSKCLIVLADEPTAQLDAENTMMVMEALLLLAKSGKTVVVATHDAAIFERATQVLDLRSGV